MDEEQKLTELQKKKGDYLRGQIHALRDAFGVKFPEDELLICARLTEKIADGLVDDQNFFAHSEINSNTIATALWDWGHLLHPYDEDEDSNAWKV